MAFQLSPATSMPQFHGLHGYSSPSSMVMMSNPSIKAKLNRRMVVKAYVHGAGQRVTAIPKVDLSRLDPGAPGWEDAQASMTASMVRHGCVVVSHGSVLSPLPELFALPVEAKQRNISKWGPFSSYLGKVPGLLRESLRVEEATDDARVREFTNLLWPQATLLFG
uniref:Non-haem dioxygenase N-terminal domain-containing protein n=1 Tax=Aegilops tauschii TaxID=37682 RepID=M8BVX1_AEGTA